MIDLLLDFFPCLFKCIHEIAVAARINLNLKLVAERVWSHDDRAHYIIVITARLLVHFKVSAAVLAQADSRGVVALESAREGLHVVIDALKTILTILLQTALEEMYKTNLLLEWPLKHCDFIRLASCRLNELTIQIVAIEHGKFFVLLG